MAIPVGDKNGGSIVTALLFAFGVWSWWKGGRRSLVVLFLTPFALNLLAAAMHLYPYGVGRLSQHLVPAICLLAGTGLAVLLQRFVHSDAFRMRWAVGVSAALAFCAVAGIVMDVVRPYRDPETRWLQQLAGAILVRLQPGDQLVVVQDRYDVTPPLRWYLQSQYRDVRWQGRVDWDRLKAENNNLVTVNYSHHRGRDASVGSTFDEPAAHGWVTVELTPYTLTPPYTTHYGKVEWTIHAEVRRWAPPPKQGEAGRQR